MTAYSTLTAALLDPDGTIDPTTINRLRRGLRTWLLAGGTLPLPRCLGLPATPGQMRRALRDVHLARAAALLDDGTTWQRAKALDRRARHFLAYRWPAWFSLREPPADANLMDAE
ncbi:MAG TPA: hypothetical protein VNT52_05080, partial [Acidimicrobiales bacterium]|nr:hypothetical protein [Acidimicrobiales bacterium]